MSNSENSKKEKVKIEEKTTNEIKLDSKNISHVNIENMSKSSSAFLKALNNAVIDNSKLISALKEAIAKHNRSGILSLQQIMLNENTADQARKLEQGIITLKKDINEKARTFIAQASPSADKDESKIRELEQTNQELLQMIGDLENKEKQRYLINSVNSEAKYNLLNSEVLKERFLKNKECDSFVMSVDIRRSTELMLKSSTPEKFSEFIKFLCQSFMDIVKANYGVFDKFTGDGILAFFPKFYSGEDAGLYAINAAIQCHDVFKSHYKASRSSFTSVILDVGLGIGIDYGKTHLVQLAESLTVVDVPVVYACRLGGAPSGRTYFNQPAYDAISCKPQDSLIYKEVSFDIKHEGSILAYDVQPSSWSFSAQKPDWVDIEKPVTAAEP